MTKIQTKNRQNNVVIGRIGSTYGLCGWLNVISFSNPKEAIFHYRPWQIEQNNGSQTVAEFAWKIQGNRLLIKLPQCTNPEEARTYVNATIIIKRAQLPALKKGEYYWQDLEGLVVINQENVELGTVNYIITTTSNDVLIVKGEKEHWIPYLNNVVLEVDLELGRIKVDWDKDF